MAFDGDAGADPAGRDALERIERQVESSQAGLESIGHVLAQTNEAVEELSRRLAAPTRADELSAERWQARLGSLENRLGLLEGTMKGEVERLRAAAGVVDMVADEFRTSLGGARNITRLTREISDRVDNLVAVLGGGDGTPVLDLAAEVGSLRAALEGMAPPIEDRLGGVTASVEALERSLAGHAQTTTVGVNRVAEEIGEAITRLEVRQTTKTGELGNAVTERLEALMRQLRELAQREVPDPAATVMPLMEQIVGLHVDRVEARLQPLADDVAALRAIPPPDLRTPLALAADRFDHLRTTIDPLAARFDALTASIDELRSRPFPAANELRGIHELLDQLRDGMIAVLDFPRPDPVAVETRLDDLRGAVAAIPTGPVDLAPLHAQLDQLRDGITAVLSAPGPDFAALETRLDDVRSAVAAIPTGPVDLAPLQAQIDQLRDGIAALLAVPAPDLSPLHGHLDDLRGTVTGQLDSLAATVGVLPREQLDLTSLAATLDDIRDGVIAVLGAPTVDLQPLHAHLDEVRSAVAALPTEATDTAQLSARIEEVRDGVIAVLGAPAVDLQPLHAHLDEVRNAVAALPTEATDTAQLSARIEEVRDGVIAALNAPPLDLGPVTDRLDQLAGELRELGTGLGADPVDLQPLHAHLEHVGTTLAAMVTPERLASPIGERIDGLVAELDRLARGREDEQGQRLLQLADGVAANAAASTRNAIAGAAGAHNTRIDEAMGRLEERLGALPAEIAGQLDAGELAERLATAVRVAAEDNLGRTEQTLEELRASVTAMVSELAGSQPDIAELLVPVRAQLDELAVQAGTSLDTAVGRLDEWRPQLEQSFGSMVNQLHQVREAGVQQHQRLDELVAAVRQLREDQPDLITSLVPLHDRLEPLGALAEQLDDVRRQLSALPEALAAAGPDVEGTLQPLRERLDQLPADRDALVAAVAAARDDLAARLDVIATTVISAHAEPLDVDALVAPLAPRFDELQAALADERSSRPDITTSLHGIAELLEVVRTAIDEIPAPAPPPEPPDLGAAVGPLHRHLETVAEQLAAAIDAARIELPEPPPPLEMPDIAAAVAPVHQHLDAIGQQLRDAIDAARIELPEPAPAPEMPDIAAAVGPLHRHLETVAEQLAAAIDAARMELAEPPPAPEMPDIAAAVAPVHQHLDAVSEQLRAAIDAARIELPEPPPAPEMPDIAAAVAPVHQHLDAIGEQLRAAIDAARIELPEPPPAPEMPDIAAALEPLHRRLADLYAAVDDVRATRPDIAASLNGLAELLMSIDASIELLRTGGDSDRFAAVEQQVAKLGDQLAVHGDRQLAELGAYAERIELAAASGNRAAADAVTSALGELGPVLTGVSAQQDALVRELAAIREATPDLAAAVEPLTSRLDDIDRSRDRIRTQLAVVIGLLEEVRSAPPTEALPAEALEGLARQITDAVRDSSEANRRELERLTDGAPAALAGAVDELVGRIDQLRGELQRTSQETAVVQDSLAASTERLLNRVDAGANRVLDSLSAGDTQLVESVRRLDVSLVDVRRDLEGLGQVVEGVSALRAQASRVTPDEFGRLGSMLSEVQRELRTTRDDLIDMSRSVSGIRSELRANDGDMSSGAGAALVASAAAAMARLEGRLDHEFDTIGHQMEALGTLVHSAIEAVEAVTVNTPGEPITDKVRSAATSVLDALRATSRQRAARRYQSVRTPPGLNRGR